MNATRPAPSLTLGPLLTAGGGLLLLISTFIAWFGSGGTDETANAWKTFDFIDIVLLLISLLAIAYGVLRILRVPLALPVDAREVAKWLGVIALTITLYTLIEVVGDGLESRFGLWLAVLSSIAILAGSLLGDRFPLGAGGPAGAPAAGRRRSADAGRARGCGAGRGQPAG